mgnify:CR=1 FL=1
MRSLVALFLIFLVYHAWFLPGALSSGDWPYLFLENIQEFSFLPDPHSLWLGAYYQIPTKILVQYLGISWEVVERLLWFWPFLLLSIFSSYHLTKSWIGVLVYTTNTYILMVVSGGQMGIAMAYAIAPFILKKFMDFANSNLFLIQSKKIFRESIVLGLILAVLTMFDPRIAYIFMIAVVIYASFTIVSTRSSFSHITHFATSIFIVPVGMAALLNSYWIIPLLFGNLSQKYEGLSSIAGFEFLSFTDFSHAFSLLHSNWPENIFGKVYFLQPEFLIIPILGYSALFFVQKDRKVLYFAFLILVGAFLAKGTNQPFGEINKLIFENIPGMNMFRDASKFYLLIALGYSFLISFSLKNISKKIPFGKLIPLIFVLFWCILIRQAIFGELGGTFKSRSIPDEYIELKRYLISQPQYSSSLWIPSRQRFGFSSNLHPGISASDILGSSDPLRMAKVISNDKDKTVYNKLKEMKIEQIIVPYDSDKELFILDRKYSDPLRDKVVTQLDKIEWLIKIPRFSENAIYRVQ